MAFNVASESGVQAVRAVGSRDGGWERWGGFSKEGADGGVWLGKSECQWQDVV